METNSENIDRLIMGYLQRQLSDEELEAFFDWLDSDSKNEEYFFHIKSLHDEISRDNFDVEESWRRLSVKISAQNRKRRRELVLRTLRWAACIVLVVAAGLAFRYSDLVLAPMPAAFVQQYEYSTKKSTVRFNLPDGTMVCMAPNTKFSYSSDYGKRQREVVLDGEAYFEVKKNKRIPFIVVSGDQRIVVTGTRFNVRSYSGSDEFVTTLLEGGIYFHSEKMQKDIHLQPGEQLRYDNRHKSIKVAYLSNAADEILWMDNRYVFNKVALSDILKRMEDIYQVRFVSNKTKAMSTTYRVTLYQDENLPEFLRVMRKMTGLAYVQKGDTIIVK